jgi:hypothetical protein
MPEKHRHSIVRRSAYCRARFICKPAREASIVNGLCCMKWPSDWRNTSTTISAIAKVITNADVLGGGS